MPLPVFLIRQEAHADIPEMLIAGHQRELITYMIKSDRSHPDTATPDAVDEYVRCYSMPGGIRAMLSIYRAMLVDAEQNRQAAQKKLDIPVLALGGSAFIGDRNESRATATFSSSGNRGCHGGGRSAWRTARIPEMASQFPSSPPWRGSRFTRTAHRCLCGTLRRISRPPIAAQRWIFLCHWGDSGESRVSDGPPLIRSKWPENKATRACE